MSMKLVSRFSKQLGIKTLLASAVYQQEFMSCTLTFFSINYDKTFQYFITHCYTIKIAELYPKNNVFVN